MNAKKKGLSIFQQPIEDNWSNGAILKINKALDITIKEVIDDYEIEWNKGNPLSPNEMRKRHLSTFADGKSNIIADKQNPPDANNSCDSESNRRSMNKNRTFS